MASTLYKLCESLYIKGDILVKTFFYRYSLDNVLPALANAPLDRYNSSNQKNLLEILKESVLWAVPKKRRTIERRRSRRFGHPDYYYKMLLPKTNILVCPKCGSYREAGLLCPTCYAKIQAETEEMQSVIIKSLGIAPSENEVVLRYQDDEKQNPEFYKGKRIVEMPKNRPKLFSDNLLQKTTQGPATTKKIITNE